MRRRNLWGAQLMTPAGEAGLVSRLWDVRWLDSGPPGAATPRALFVSRRHARAWVRQVNADLAGWPCRLRVVRVRESVELA